jgi:hypothetical protein
VNWTLSLRAVLSGYFCADNLIVVQPLMNVEPLFYFFLVLAPNFGRLTRVYRFGVLCNNSSKLENSVCGVYVYAAAITLNEGG